MVLTSKKQLQKRIFAPQAIGVGLVLFAISSVSAAGNAATTPDAGQILQEIERNLEVKPLPAVPKIEELVPEPEDQGPKVTIKAFKFEGNQLISEAELQGALETLMGREISITELKTAPDLIAAFYRERGFIATALLPEQDITEGVVIIKVVEAIFAEAKVDGEYGKDYKRIRPSVIESVIEHHQPKGKPLNQNLIDKAIAVLKKMTGFLVTPAYKAGRAEGTTDLVLSVKDKPLFSASVIADNSGGRSTGRDKQTATASFASPLGFGDSLNFVGLHSRGTDYVSAAYSLPVGSQGLQLGLNVSQLNYEVILNEYRSTSPKGSSFVLGFGAKYPLIMAKNGSLDFELNYDRKDFTNQVKASGAYVDSNDYNVDVASIKLIGTYNDNFIAGGVNTAQIDIGRGKVDLNGSGIPGDASFDHKKNDHESANTQGYYSRLKWNLSRTQFLSDSVSLNLDASGQFANKNLDSSEKFYLGGASGVRAYPTSEGAGSEGYLLKLELRKYLPNDLTVSAFIDEGYVKQYHDNQYNAGTHEGQKLTTDGSPNGYSLRGYGLSATWNGPYNSTLKATYARRFGHNPNPSVDTTTGAEHDQDGALKKDVFWVSGSIAF